MPPYIFMATYAVNLYLSTGFNAINIPDSPEVLAGSGTVTSVPAVHILQNKFLTQLDVTTSWAVAELVDYLSVGDFYYSVTGVQMLSESTVRFFIVPDFITSAGGALKLNILDGITSRATVADDTFGKYTDDDPLTAPQKPLAIYGEWLLTGAIATDGHTYLSTTLDLVKQGQQSEGVTYTDPETGETVTVPKTYEISKSQQTETRLYAGEPSELTPTTGPKDGTIYYDMGVTSDTDANLYVSKGLSKARSLGIESAIIDQWEVPNLYASPVEDSTGAISALAGSKGSVQCTLPTNYKTDVQNKRVLYGKYNSYGIMTASGNSVEAKPEDIVTDESTTSGPSITWLVDPRPDGKPYFRFSIMNGNQEFWRNCVDGEQWQKVPLVYQGASGSALTRLNFDNQRRVESTLADQYYEQNKVDRFNEFLSDFTGGILGGRRTAIRGAAAANKAGISAGDSAIGIGAAVVGNVFQGGADYITYREQSLRERDNYKTNYAITKANELSALYQATEVYAPQVVFPYNSSIIRDVKGNGIYVYRYEYQLEDINRIDKLLTMYGYKEAEELTTANFTRRTYFDYVECSTVTVTGVPKWMADGISAQLTTGVRVWHTKPSSAYYSSNPIRSAA